MWRTIHVEHNRPHDWQIVVLDPDGQVRWTETGLPWRLIGCLNRLYWQLRRWDRGEDV